MPSEKVPFVPVIRDPDPGDEQGTRNKKQQIHLFLDAFSAPLGGDPQSKVRLVKHGTYARIGDDVGVSREYVRQVADAGVNGHTFTIVNLQEWADNQDLLELDILGRGIDDEQKERRRNQGKTSIWRSMTGWLFRWTN
jgi:hypothetical protein